MSRFALLFALSFALAACSPIANGAARVVVEWTTATEINTGGFNLYRSERAEGPFVKVNAQLIPAAPDPVVGGKYRYEDASVAPGATYYYQLEDVGLSGATARHGPIAVILSSFTARAAAPSAPAAAVGLGMLTVLGVGVGVWLARRGKQHCNDTSNLLT